MTQKPVKLLGLDPGLRFTGWGIVESDGNRLRHIADGVISTDSIESVPLRLKALDDALTALLLRYLPDEAAVEETYVNRNATATLKLGYARGVALLAPARSGCGYRSVPRRSPRHRPGRSLHNESRRNHPRLRRRRPS